MTSAQKQLLTLLQQLNIATNLYMHEPLFTVDQANATYDQLTIPGARCKNLFIKDSKKRLYLLVALADTKIELKKLSKEIGAPELRFADAQLMQQYLGVEPGSVTPLGLINDTEHALTVILDSGLLNNNLLTFHPLKNDATVTITPADLQKFIAHCGNQIIVHAFA